MPRYEYAKGSSNKFWEIKLSSSSFTTTYGKVGTVGQTTSKSFASAADAKKAYEKLIAAKTKKGYVLAKGGAKKTAAKKAPAKKAAAKKTPAKKAAAKKAPAKKVAAKKTPAKKAAAKKAPAKKAVANNEGELGGSASGKKGARYFEFVDGKSSKFWEVLVEGDAVVTRYGRIGAEGQTKSKATASASAAKKARDKLVSEKVKKGYAEIGAPGGGPVTANNPALEAEIFANPEDPDNYAVLSDWLQEQGDPRGELISLFLNNKEKRAKKLLDKHADYFLGDLQEHTKVRDAGWNNASSSLRNTAQDKVWQKTHQEAFLWRNGYIDRVRLSHDTYSDGDWEGKTVDVLDEVLSHPSSRFVREFAFHSNGDPSEDDLQDLLDLLGKKAPLTTRKITLGDNVDQISWHHTGNLSKMWKGVPNLKVLEVETGRFDVGKMVAPSLERAVFITGGLSASCGKNIAKAQMPNIKHLEVYYGDPEYGGHCSIKEVKPLLARTDLRHLEYLGLKNAMFADEIAKTIGGSKVLKSLKTLDMSEGAMTDAGARALIKAKASLKHLECLDLRSNFLTKAVLKEVQAICKSVLVKSQNEPWDFDDDEPHYYVSVAE